MRQHELSSRIRIRIRIRIRARAQRGALALCCVACIVDVGLAQQTASRPVPPDELTIRAKAPGGAPFQIVRAPVTLRDGRIAFLALVSGGWELCVFSSTGAHAWSTPLRTSGTATSLAAVGDTLAVLHHGPEGVVIAKYLQGRAMPVRETRHAAEARNVYTLLSSVGGPMLVQTTIGSPDVIPRCEVRRADTALNAPPLVAIADPGPHVVIGAGRGNSRVLAAPWAPRVSFAGGQEELVVATGLARILEVHDLRGARTRTINLGGATVPMTEAVREQWLASWRTAAGRGLPDSTERLLRATRLPAVRPTLRAVHTGLGGEIVVVRDDVAGFRNVNDSTYVDVHSATGARLASFVIEPGGTLVGLGAAGTALVTRRDPTGPVVEANGRTVPSVVLSIVRFAPPTGTR